MKNSESGSSSQFPLRRSRRLLGKSRRRSLRLLGKSPVIVKQRIPSIRKPRERYDLVAAQFMRSMRKSRACIFRHKYIYDGSIDKRVYIDSSGDSYSWTGRSTGCIWVAVHGMKCMFVAFKGTLDPARYPGFSMNMVYRFYSLNVISEIEDLVLSNCESRQPLDKHVTKPFGVVSVIRSTSNGQESGDEASGALKYLKKRFESGMEFTYDETMQTAVYALQRECNQEFKVDDDIWVCRLEHDAEYHLQREELEMLLADINTPLQTEEIKEHLAVINNEPLLTDMPLPCFSSPPISSPVLPSSPLSPCLV